MERMQLEYNKSARDAGVYIISACGFDSIPCDLGIIYTQEKFEGELNSVETYLNTWQTVNVGGPSLNYATWESAVYGLAHANELRGLRRKLFPERLPEMKPKLPMRYASTAMHRNREDRTFQLSLLESPLLFTGVCIAVLYRMVGAFSFPDPTDLWLFARSASCTKNINRDLFRFRPT